MIAILPARVFAVISKLRCKYSRSHDTDLDKNTKGTCKRIRDHGHFKTTWDIVVYFSQFLSFSRQTNAPSFDQENRTIVPYVSFEIHSSNRNWRGWFNCGYERIQKRFLPFGFAFPFTTGYPGGIFVILWYELQVFALFVFFASDCVRWKHIC